MRAQFLCPPMLGSYLKENARPDELPIRACLVLAWDDHLENYLIADRETGEQQWLGVASVQVDCGSIITTMTIADPAAAKTSDEPTSDDGCDENDDDEDRCPVCKQLMP
jgi:hypothetical protein